MNIQKFLINKCHEIKSSVKSVTLTYAYDSVTDFNIIEVEPENIRRGNNEYIRLESELWSDFNKSFPNKNLLISEKDSCNNMSNCIFKI